MSALEQDCFCYVAFKDGEPGFYAAAVDSPAFVGRCVDFVTEALEFGAHVSRVSLESAKAGLAEYYKWDELTRCGPQPPAGAPCGGHR
jgi:hypothetical protein